MAGYIRWVLNEYLRVTALYDALKVNANDATRLALLADFDQVLGGVPSRRMVIKAVSSSRRPWCR